METSSGTNNRLSRNRFMTGPEYRVAKFKVEMLNLSFQLSQGDGNGAMNRPKHFTINLKTGLIIGSIYCSLRESGGNNGSIFLEEED
jgi:hypothetical protein